MYNDDLTASLLLTRECNESCGYCNKFDIVKNSKKVILKNIPNLLKVRDILLEAEIKNVELTGGEVGMIDNIEEIIEIFNDFSIDIPTNGLLLDKFPSKPSINYYVHFIQKIEDIANSKMKILKYFKGLNIHNVIVGTPGMLEFLLNNKTFLGNAMLSVLEERTYIVEYNDITSLNASDYIELFNNVHQKFLKLESNKLTKRLIYANQIKNCSISSKNIKIDVDNMKMSQCVHIDNVYADFNVENLLLHREGLIFPFNEQCLSCLTYKV